jgi:signal recognition particle receptor subunit beta
VFVVDSNDGQRIAEAAEELRKVLFYLPTDIVLVFANKQDLPTSMDMGEFESQMNFSELSAINLRVQPCCSTSGHGLKEGLTWMHETIRMRIN